MPLVEQGTEAGCGGFAAGTAKGRAPLRRGLLRQGKNINEGFVPLVLCLWFFPAGRKAIWVGGELFAARLLEGFVISQQRPAATQARHRKPALIV